MPTRPYHLANDDRVPGVTTVLGLLAKPALVPWANGLGFDGINSTVYVDNLAGAGTLAHCLIQTHLTGGGTADYFGYTLEQIALAESALASFCSWEAGKSLETQETELALVSEEHRYGGTLDWYGLLDGRPTLVDFKTSEAIWAEHLYQLAAYAHLLVENGYPLEEARILQLSRGEGETWSERVMDVDDVTPYFAVFQAALALKSAIDATEKLRFPRRRVISRGAP